MSLLTLVSKASTFSRLLACLQAFSLLSNQQALAEPYRIPENAFYHNSPKGRVLDVTKAPFLAKGDGITDDTNALIRAYDFVLARIDEKGWGKARPASRASSYIIYLPRGTYLVSDTIIYSGPTRWLDVKRGTLLTQGQPRTPGLSEAVAWIRFQGEDANNTIIRLQDNAQGFQLGAKRPILSFGKGDFNNLVANNTLRDLTINAGKGNPGAIGVRFAGANNSSIARLRVLSEDLGGYVGIDIDIAPTMGWHHSITVDGFDYGIKQSPYHATHNSWEHITLTRQRVAALLIEEASVSIRKLMSVNAVPAVKQTGEGSSLVLLESDLRCTGPCAPAFVSDGGQMFLRDVHISGYKNAIAPAKQEIDQTGFIREFLKGPYLSTRPTQDRQSLRLPIEDPPSAPLPLKPDLWVSPEEFGAKGDGVSDDTQSLEKALGSGKPVVYLPSHAYYIRGTVRVPASVERIVGLYSLITRDKAEARIPFLVVQESSTNALIIEDTHVDPSGVFISHQGNRSLVLSNVTTMGTPYVNYGAPPGVKLFLNNVSGWGKSDSSCRDQKVWARFVNTESKSGANFHLQRCDAWIFGYKTEKININFDARDRSRLEILGGVTNQFDASMATYNRTDTPIIRLHDSAASATLVSSGPSRTHHGFGWLVEDVQGGERKRISWSQLVSRPGRRGQIHVPLYTGGHILP